MLETVTRESFADRLSRQIRTFFHRVRAVHHFRSWRRRSVHLRRQPQILTISADVSFYTWVLGAANSWGWRAEWARSVKRGVEICRSEYAPIVIYDRNLPNVDWRRALDQLSMAASGGRVLLAASEVDEDLWRLVLRRHGYDVLARSAGAEQLKRELRFAWLSLQEPTEDVAPSQPDSIPTPV
jgi:hypothetical protein